MSDDQAPAPRNPGSQPDGAAPASESGAATQPPPTTQSAEQRRRAQRRWAWLPVFYRPVWWLLGLLVLLVVGLGLTWRALHDEGGTARLLSVLPGVTVLEPQGPLLGDFSARRLEIGLPRGSRLNLVEPRWTGMDLRRDHDAPWGLGLVVSTLQARRVELIWISAPAQTPPTPETGHGPKRLSSPVSLRVDQLTVGEFSSNLLGSLSLIDIAGKVQAQQRVPRTGAEEAGFRHHVELQSLTVQGWSIQGEASLRTEGDLRLSAELLARSSLEGGRPAATAAPTQGDAVLPVGQAQLILEGPLRHFKLTGTVQLAQPAASSGAAGKRGGATPDLQMQSLGLSAEVTPFDAWPLPHLLAKVANLDLSRLWQGLPETGLTGELGVTAQDESQPDLRIHVALDNRAAGPWDARRLPVQRLQGHVALPQHRSAADEKPGFLAGRAAKGQAVPLGQLGSLNLEAVLAGLANQAGGTVTLSGQWDQADARRTRLRADLKALQAQALDGRAPALLLGGPLVLQATPATGASSQDMDWRHWSFSADLKGQGQLAGGRHPVAMNLHGALTPEVLSLASLQLRSGAAGGKEADSGAALAELKGKLELAHVSGWRSTGQLRLQRFDPQLWLPWPKAAAGGQSLNGAMSFDIDALWRGQLKGQLDRSQLAGVPLEGMWSWQGPARSSEMSASVDFTAGANQIEASGVLPVQRTDATVSLSGQRPQRWKASVQAPALQNLRALAQGWGWSELQGQVQAQASATGVWPMLDSQGELNVQGVRVRSPDDALYAIRSIVGQWDIGTSALTAPMQAQLTVEQARLGAVSSDSLVLKLSGQSRAHELHLNGVVGLPRNEDAQALEAGKTVEVDAARPSMRTQKVLLEAAVEGGFQRELKGWQGRVAQLGAITQEATPRTLLSASDVAVQWESNETRQLLQVSPSRVVVLGAALQIRSLNWNLPTGPGAIGGQADVLVDLEPLNLASTLQHLQPEQGWDGDLMVAGRLRMSHSARQPWVVDGVLERTAGDLSMSDLDVQGNTRQGLGIREARVELKAREGVWTLRQDFEGRVLGTIRGQQHVHTRQRESLPSAADTLGGSLDLNIRNLRPWGMWVPAGWRMSGQLDVHAELSGTLGAPQYTGQVLGHKLALAHALQGVNITDGELQLDLRGDHARLVFLRAKGGEGGGTISLQGEADLGAAPQATLQLEAQRFALLQRVDRRAMVSGQATLKLGAESIDVNGRFVVDGGLVDISRSDAPTIGDDVYVVNRPGEAPQDAPEVMGTGGAGQREVKVLVDVDLGQDLWLKGRGLSAKLVGALRLTTPNGRPAVHGVIRTESGSYVAYAQNLVIEHGSVTFTGPIENPRLDILAMRAQSPMADSTDVKVGVTITGTAQDPRVRLYSDPILSETEKLSWLILGRGPAGLGGADIGLLQTAASALLAGEGGSPKDSVLSAIGLDTLSVYQSDDDVKGTVVNLGKQISTKWYLGYERSLNETAGNWQLIYRLAQRFTVRAQAGEDSALDLIWSWRFD